MIVIPSLHNATIFLGDFLLAMMSTDAASPTACRINRAVNHEELIVTWWIYLADVSSRPNFQHINSVQDISFVFHINIIEHEYPNCAGMSRVFYMQCQYNNREF